MSAGAIDHYDADVTEADIAVARQIAARRAGGRATDYRRALIDRYHARPDAKPPVSSLPGGGYKKYRLIAGRHQRRDQKDVLAAQQATLKDRERRGPGFPPVEAPVHVFQPGDIVIPETDEEAIALDQDPNKFREVGTANDEAEGIDVLLAENNRLKAVLARQEELDRREKELADREAALAGGAAGGKPKGGGK